MTETPTKLQVRAKIFDIIKSYSSDADFTSIIHINNMKLLSDIGNKQFVCEILLKELTSAIDFELEVVKNLLADFASLELVEDLIWKFLQDKTIPDNKKEVYLQVLRALGGKIDVQLLMECMQDFNSVIDEQTLGLLEVATVNPEAQIDFIDFLLSLKKDEQLQLIQSLKTDFKGDELANIFSPTLLMDIANEVKQEVILVLGTTNSYLAIKPLKNFISAQGSEELKPIAIKALNQLKNSGINIDDVNLINLRENEICKSSMFYKAFLSQVDGCGNQGLIFSRITNDNKIIVFSTVLNIAGGIMDCFGFYSISANDFHKIVSRFKANDYVVPIPAEIAKYKLEQAEKVTSSIGSVMPYEYSCWSVYTCDIVFAPINYEELVKEKITNFDNDLYKCLYDTEVFDSWFFEYDDCRNVQLIIDNLIAIKDNDIDYIFRTLEEKIADLYYEVFTPNKIEEYSQMLLDTAFVFSTNYDYLRSNITANLAVAIKNDETHFLKDIIRRSILQYLANVVANEDETKKIEEVANRFLEKKDVSKISSQEAFSLLQKLEEKWDNLVENE